MASQISNNVAAPQETTVTVIESDQGPDLLIGEAGADVFHITSVEASSKAGQDTIEGFGTGDLISFSGIALQGADAPTTLHWAGVEPDSGRAYGVWQWADGTLRADINGDSTADISVDLQGKLLSAADFDFGQDSFGPTQSQQPQQPGNGGSDLSIGTTAWAETFDNGTGILSRTWGPGIDTSVSGQVTIHSTADNQDSGAMVPPSGPADSGYGYGLYSFTLSMGQGDAPGPYALLWPGTDVWPGPELDLIELLPGGDAYSTIHWKGDDGSNQSQSYGLGNVDVTQTHTYALLWEQGRLSGYIDGQEAWTTTERVPNDYAHGGENSAPGIGMQTWWSADAQHGSGYDNSITLYDMSYAVIA